MELKPKFLAIVQHLSTQARNRAVRAVEAVRVRLYWHLGQIIVEAEQHGADRAAYGAGLVQGLAAKLQPQVGSS